MNCSRPDNHRPITGTFEPCEHCTPYEVTVYPLVTTADKLQLGDVIRTFEGAWSTAVVIDKNSMEVRLFRPYVKTGSFATASGVTPFTGHEYYSVYLSTHVYLIERGPEIR